MISEHTDSRKALREWNARQKNRDLKRDESNAEITKDLEPRNKKICELAQREIDSGKTPGSIIKMLANRYGLSDRQVRNILKDKNPGWDSGQKYKR